MSFHSRTFPQISNNSNTNTQISRALGASPAFAGWNEHLKANPIKKGTPPADLLVIKKVIKTRRTHRHRTTHDDTNITIVETRTARNEIEVDLV